MRDAPSKVLRQVEDEAHALRISISAGNYKLDYIAARIGKSRAYVSRMQKGKRPIPEKLVPLLCAATGTNLLAQFIEREREECPVERLASLLRIAA